ncbi:hypothetical protein [Microvirga puerhi]|uniref:Uncharacterized protein n=1 Tax=Microvirga puerhi TaxID=2876078 RepID=A0ABS7VSV4_9HYPH|nr:hypothetical protein [Microvirga puerhi]MBZ6078067.1 hypothetical protein [Microvirga puerhi]
MFRPLHAGIVQYQIADIDQLSIEKQDPRCFGQVTARLPAGRQTKGARRSPPTADRADEEL